MVLDSGVFGRLQVSKECKAFLAKAFIIEKMLQSKDYK